jgi:protein-tyrosine phosphatase
MKANPTTSHHSLVATHQAFTDIHCHLLPGIDDGPKDWNSSLVMARLAVANGISEIVTTPHQLGRYENNTADRILALCAEAQRRIHDAGLPLSVLPGADVRIQEDLPELVLQGRVLTLGNPKSEARNPKQIPSRKSQTPNKADEKVSDIASSNLEFVSDFGFQISYLLLELPHEQVLPLGRLFYQLQNQGITAILSHPERNQHLQENPDIVRPWVQQGCLIQVTTGSIAGKFGRAALRTSRWLFDENLVHLAATDAHDVTRRPPEWQDAFDRVSQWEGRARAHMVFFQNPQAVVQGQPIEAPLPATASRSGLTTWFSSALATLRR